MPEDLIEATKKGPILCIFILVDKLAAPMLKEAQRGVVHRREDKLLILIHLHDIHFQQILFHAIKLIKNVIRKRSIFYILVNYLLLLPF